MQQRAVTDGILFRSLQASYSLQGVISHLGSSPSSGAPAVCSILSFLLHRRSKETQTYTQDHFMALCTAQPPESDCLVAGHFTADVLDAKGRWFRHNDALVQQIWPKTDVGLQRSREETAYMLVYIADGL